MNGLNRIFLLGYLGSDPQLRSTKSGHTYAALNLATHRASSRERTGEALPSTDWHQIQVWGKQAEICSKYLTKGQAVLVEGYLTHYSQLDESTSKVRKKTSIHALKVEFLPRSNRPDEQIKGPP